MGWSCVELACLSAPLTVTPPHALAMGASLNAAVPIHVAPAPVGHTPSWQTSLTAPANTHTASRHRTVGQLTSCTCKGTPLAKTHTPHSSLTHTLAHTTAPWGS